MVLLLTTETKLLWTAILLNTFLGKEDTLNVPHKFIEEIG